MSDRHKAQAIANREGRSIWVIRPDMSGYWVRPRSDGRRDHFRNLLSIRRAIA